MGCGFSRRVVPNASNEVSDLNGASNKFISDGLTRQVSESLTGNEGEEITVKDTSLSFIVPIRDPEDIKDGSIIRRHPPVRLRRLEEEQQVNRPKLTLGALERRQAEAEERRRKILDSRVQSAQHFQRKVQPDAGTATLSPSPSPSTNWDQEKDPELDHDKRRDELPS